MTRRTGGVSVGIGAALALAAGVFMNRSMVEARAFPRQDAPPVVGISTPPPNRPEDSSLPPGESAGLQRPVAPAEGLLPPAVQEPASPSPPRAEPASAPWSAEGVGSGPSDPVDAANGLVARTIGEAESAVESLNKEAAELRARLAKVEAGLDRYTRVLEALKETGNVPATTTGGDPAGEHAIPEIGEPALEPVPETNPPGTQQTRDPMPLDLPAPEPSPGS